LTDAAARSEAATFLSQSRGFGRFVSSPQRDKNGKTVATVKNPPIREKNPLDEGENFENTRFTDREFLLYSL
jgi:hypothetical protein